MTELHKEILYYGWTIYGWSEKSWGVFYPNNENSGKIYPSFASARKHIKEIEGMLKRDNRRENYASNN